jgi:hypothetical protein
MTPLVPHFRCSRPCTFVAIRCPSLCSPAEPSLPQRNETKTAKRRRRGATVARLIYLCHYLVQCGRAHLTFLVGFIDRLVLLHHRLRPGRPSACRPHQLAYHPANMIPTLRMYIFDQAVPAGRGLIPLACVRLVGDRTFAFRNSRGRCRNSSG